RQSGMSTWSMNPNQLTGHVQSLLAAIGWADRPEYVRQAPLAAVDLTRTAFTLNRPRSRGTSPIAGVTVPFNANLTTGCGLQVAAAEHCGAADTPADRSPQGMESGRGRTRQLRT